MRVLKASRPGHAIPRVATAGGSSNLNFTPAEKILMLAFDVPV